MPVQDSVQADTVQCLIDLLAHRNIIGRAQVTGTLVHKARNKLVESALNGFQEATHILFIDDDMSFKTDDLDKLLDSGKDIVGSVCVERNPPFHPCFVPKDEKWSDFRPLLEGTSDSLLEVDSVGMGFTLIKISVLKDMLKKNKNLFFFDDTDFGEDFNFCKIARKFTKIYVRTDSQVGHISNLPVMLQHFTYNIMNNPATKELKEEIFAEDNIQDSKD